MNIRSRNHPARMYMVSTRVLIGEKDASFGWETLWAGPPGKRPTTGLRTGESPNFTDQGGIERAPPRTKTKTQQQKIGEWRQNRPQVLKYMELRHPRHPFLRTGAWMIGFVCMYDSGSRFDSPPPQWYGSPGPAPRIQILVLFAACQSSSFQFARYLHHFGAPTSLHRIYIDYLHH